jgi:hypothetical protein
MKSKIHTLLATAVLTATWASVAGAANAVVIGLAGWLDRYSRKAAAALISSLISIFGLTGSASAATFSDLTLVYDASFDGGSLGSPIDPLGLGPLKKDALQFPGSNPTWAVNDGYVQLGVTQPDPSPGLVDVELAAKPVKFDTGSVFGMRATFISPAGPHISGETWASVLSFRSGNENIQPADARGAIGLRISGTSAVFSAPGSNVAGGLQTLPQAAYNAIFDPVNPQPYTLQLLLDRSGGFSNATLQVGNSIYSYDIQFPGFTSTSGPAITALAPTLAINNAPGQSATVRLLDYQIFLPQSAVPEPRMWLSMLVGFIVVGGAIRRGRSIRRNEARFSQWVMEGWRA